MRVYQLGAGGGIEDIRICERTRPKPGPREVLVRMRAASLNYLDLMILDGRFSTGAQAGIVPLSDGAGEIVELGEGVRRLKLADRVASTFFPLWVAGSLPAEGRSDLPGATRDGMLAEYVVFDENALVQIPANLSFEEASTLPCAALTAWESLVGARALLPGEVMLTQGSGGVSIFALQFAKLAGARVIVTTSSEQKAARLKALGADEVINYSVSPDWPVVVKALTNGLGADHIMEIGGAGTLEKSVDASAVGAQINMVGVLEQVTHVNASLFMRGLTTIRRISVGSRASFEAMNRAIAFHQLKPVVDRVFGFGEAPQAYRYLCERNHFGKVVISIE
jgi:NADPH:quinone reductase-like Zn-dependent oxidoreductase